MPTLLHKWKYKLITKIIYIFPNIIDMPKKSKQLN